MPWPPSRLDSTDGRPEKRPGLWLEFRMMIAEAVLRLALRLMPAKHPHTHVYVGSVNIALKELITRLRKENGR